MIGKKINQLATELAPASTDLTIIGNPTTGVSKKITLAQLGAIFSGAVSFYTNLAAFPTPGTTDVIYCAKDTQKLYLWSGSAYVEVFPSQALLDTYQLRSEKGNANGYASLDSQGKVPISQLPSSIMEYKGTWNASTNTPTLANGTGDTGDVYICNVAGTVNFGAGPITFAVGDYVIYSGTIWQRSSGAVGTVTSVAASITGNAIGITGSPVTTSGTLAFAFAGTGAQYIKGDGTLATFPTTIDQAKNLITEVYNSTGATLTKGTVVYINGGQGNLPTVTKALASGDSTSAQTYGIVQADITNNNNGFVVVAGRLADIDTSAFSVGTQLYLSSTTAGAYTSTKQYAPAHLVYVGIIVRSHPTQGIIEVKIQNGYELDELHNVAAQTPTNNDGLFWESSTSLWKNKSIATILGGTPVIGSGTQNRITKWSFTTGEIINSSLVDTGGSIYNTLTNPGQFSWQFNGDTGAGLSFGALINAGTNASDIALRIQNASSTSVYFYVWGDGRVQINNIPNATTDTDRFLVSDSGVIKYRTGAELLSDIGGQAAINGTGFVKASGTTISYDNSTYVTTDTFQTISASKTFSVGLSLASAGGTNQITSFANANSIHSGSAGTNVLGFNNSNNIYFGKGLDNGGVISWNNSTVRFYTLPNATGTIALTSDLTGGTVTSVGLSSATSGVTIGSTPITTSGTITLAIATASGSQQGLLSSTDWTTFNNKQNALTNPVTGTGTTNYLPKFTGTSTIGNSLVFDNGTNVGIGTASPQANLHIQSTQASMNMRSTGTGSPYIDFYTSSTSLVGNFYALNGGGLVWGTSGGTERMRLDNSGNLGLGVTPSAWASGLSVFQGSSSLSVGNSGNGGMNVLANAYYGSNWTYVSSAASSWYQQIDGKHAWYNAPSGTAGNAISFTQAMTLNASGNLSIGNTNNTYKLDVTGQIRVNGNTNEQLILDYTTAAGGFSWQSFRLNGVNKYRLVGNVDNSFGIYSDILSAYTLTIASTGAATFSSSVTTGGNVLVPAGSGLAWSGDASRIMTPEDNVSGALIQTPGIIRFNAGSSEKMRITSGGLVNIGTTTAYTSRLNVQSTSPSVAAIKAGYGGVSGNGYTILADNYTTNESLMSIGIDYSSGGLVLGSAMAPSTTTQGAFISTQAQFGGFGSAIRLSTSGEILFYRGTQDSIISTGSPKGAAISLFINNSGNVGIGTTSPSARLHSYSSTTMNQLTVDGVGSIKTGINFANGGTTYGQIYFDNNAPYDLSLYQQYSTGSLIFGTNNTERMRITSGGNVGIGTTAPAKTLTVVNTAEQLRISYASGVYTDFRNDSAGGLLINTSGGYIINYIGGTERLRIKTNTINISSIPTSSAGLSSGDLYSSAGVLMIV